jgi:ABC-2 type transport system permease protein
MRPYLAILSARFRLLLQYRAAALAGLVTQIAFGWIRLMIFEAYYRSAPPEVVAAMPMTHAQVVDYIWLGQALLGLILWSADAEVMQQIRTGQVAVELLKPVDLYSLWYVRAVAMRTAPTLLRFVPMVLLAWLFFGLRLPASPAAGLAFAASVAAAVMLACAVTVIVNASMFWTVSGEGVARLVPAMMWTLTGIVLPLPFFPDWLRPVLEALPFAGLMDLPFRLYTGHIAVSDALRVLGVQALWIGVLVLMGRWLVASGLRRVVVQGG